ncbi:MAG: TonB-dependent receptor [Chitinophagaceae bacterium]|nr:TonB-dependent receptor [Chitinophagaceae bacterium]
MSLRSVLLVLFFSLGTVIAKSQDIALKGKVADKTDNSAVVGATVKLVSVRDSSQIKLVVTDKAGNFTFNNLNTGGYRLYITFSGYEKIEQRVNLQASNITPLSFSIAKVATELGDVTVVAKAAPARQKGDTTEYSAGQFKVNPDATAEDMIKKLPGVTVGRDGTVTAMGEQVRKVTVDGKEFFGDDATAALKNLPASVIDKIQVFDRLSDQAQLTGFDDGNSVKTVNIVTKSGIKNGQFGRIYAGGGTDSRYAAGGNVSFFKGDRRLSLVANFNNINQQNFASQDLLGATSSSGGGRGGGRGGMGGGSDNFNVGQSSGISKTNALGINFSNVYAKKLTLTGSYFFNNSHNTNESVTNTETFDDTKNRFSLQKSTSVNDNTNHRLNLRLEYKIDSANSLFIIPNVSFQKSRSSSFSSQNIYEGLADSISNLVTPKSTSDRNGYNIRNNLFFRHSFPKRGRSLSVGFNTTFTKNDGESISDTRYRFYDSLYAFAYDSIQNRFIDNATNGYTIGGNIAYTEPIGKKGQLQFDYNLSVQKNKADQQNFSYDGQKYSVFDTSLSNRFDNTITTNNVGVNYRLGQSRDEQLSFGVNFQAAKLQSQRIFPTASSVDQSFANILPNLMWRKKLSANVNVRVFYRASTNFPSVTQLQDVVNNNNPLYVTSGNPDLKQSYTHFLSGRYAYTNSKTSKSFFANLFLQTAGNYISNASYFIRGADTVINNVKVSENSQFTKPVNLNGYKSLRTFFTYSMPLKFIKTTLNVSTGFSYSKLPGMVDYQKIFTNSYAYNGGVVLASNISEYVDFNLSYNANLTKSKTNTTRSTSSESLNQTIGAQVNLLSKNGWFIQNDVSGNTYSGLSGGLNQSFWLWNAAIGKKFLKNKAGELKLSVFDLLKQNQSITRTITDTYIQDVQTQVLRQYFMLTFTYSLKNFGVAATSNNQNRGDRQFGPGGGGNWPF